MNCIECDCFDDALGCVCMTSCPKIPRRNPNNTTKRGRWIKAPCSEKNGDSYCSECNHFDWSDCNFCSHCGADMRDTKDLLVFSKRKRLSELYKKWQKENDIKDCPLSIVTFLYSNDLLNTDNVLSFIAKEGDAG